jgi:hypothetical protein
MNWGNCVIRRLHKGGDGAISAIDAELHLEGAALPNWPITNFLSEI